MDPAQPAPPHRWGLGAFVVVEAVYLVSAVALALAVVLGRADASSVLAVAGIVAHAIANLLPGLVLMFTVAGVMPAA